MFFIVYVPATVDRIIDWVNDGNSWFWIVLLHSISISLQGFLNAIVYGFSLRVIREAVTKIMQLQWNRDTYGPLLKVEEHISTRMGDVLKSEDDSEGSSTLVDEGDDANDGYGGRGSKVVSNRVGFT